jgi:riboflavin kinase
MTRLSLCASWVLLTGVPLSGVAALLTPAATVRSLSRQTCWATRFLSAVTTESNNSPRYRLLEERLSLRGPVDTGYGRGGKKLGFPTANLPSSLFQDALADVTNGVYFGWAVLEGSTKGRGVPHKAVVNVGYSPTFEGAENPEKIVEAHLIFPPQDEEEEAPAVLDPPDFYGETMRLQLDAFMREEQKFPSFPELVAQITADVHDSGVALTTEPYASFAQSSFLRERLDDPWIGTGGGDATASWEQTGMQEYL